MSNRYRKYFDNISPNEKLVEETKKKMLDELDKKNKIDIRPYAAVAACLAFVVSAVVLAQSMTNSPLKNDMMTETHAAAENITEKDRSDICGTTSLSEKITDVCTDITSICQNETEEIYLTTLVFPTETNAPETENKFSESSFRTENTIITRITPLSRVPDTYLDTQPPAETTVFVQETENEKPVPEEPVSSSGGLILRPGISETENTAVECTTAVQYTNICETTSVSYDTSEFCRELDVDGRTIFLNLGSEYEYNFPEYPSKVSMENAEDHFGRSFVPPPLSELYPQKTGYANKYDRDHTEGICYVFGDETYIDKVSGRFVSMTVSNSETSYGYNISCVRPVSTVINGEEYVFGTIVLYENTYFCRFVHDGIYYKFLFKGYSAEEMMEIILSMYT